MAPTAFQQVRDTLIEFLTREKELAKLELKPAAKHGAFGTGFAGGAAVFLLHAGWMFVVTLAFAIGWIFEATLHMSVLGAFTIGFLISMIFALIVAVILALLARGQFKKVKAPTATIEEAKATFIAITDTVSGAELLSTKPSTRALKDR